VSNLPETFRRANAERAVQLIPRFNCKRITGLGRRPYHSDECVFVIAAGPAGSVQSLTEATP